MDKYHGYHADPLPRDLTSRFSRLLQAAPREEIEILCHRGTDAFLLESTPWNNCFLLAYVQHSGAHLCWDDGSCQLPPGSFLLLRPRPMFSLQCTEECGETLLVFFRKRLLYQTLLPLLGRSSSVFDFIIRCMEKNSPDRLLHFAPPHNSRLHHALYALLIASSELAPDMEKLKENCIGTLLIFFSRYYQHQHTAGEGRKDLGTLLRYLSENCTDTSLESCAAYFNYNPSYLSRLIREQFGRNFSELLRDFKLEHACMLLRETQLPITQIANLTGYNHMGNFYKQFKGKYGFSPKELRDKFFDIGQKKIEDE